MLQKQPRAGLQECPAVDVISRIASNRPARHQRPLRLEAQRGQVRIAARDVGWIGYDEIETLACDRPNQRPCEIDLQVQLRALRFAVRSAPGRHPRHHPAFRPLLLDRQRDGA